MLLKPENALSLLETDYVPNDTEAETLQASVKAYRKPIRECRVNKKHHESIKKFEEDISESIRRKRDLKNTIKAIKGLPDHIRRLAPEILSEITSLSEEAPLLLLRVCKR